MLNPLGKKSWKRFRSNIDNNRGACFKILAYVFGTIIIIAIFTGLGPQLRGSGGYLSIINATPYEWRLTYSHKYQMDWEFPEYINSGMFTILFLQSKF
jgi:hypothetical protein